jgi:hypothetical protein
VQHEGIRETLNDSLTLMRRWRKPLCKFYLWLCRYDAHAKSGKGGSSLASELGKLMDKDTTRWLLTEMAQNRDKKVIRDKVTACTASLAIAIPYIFGSGCTGDILYKRSQSIHPCATLLSAIVPSTAQVLDLCGPPVFPHCTNYGFCFAGNPTS